MVELPSHKDAIQHYGVPEGYGVMGFGIDNFDSRDRFADGLPIRARHVYTIRHPYKGL